jgi:hypothetical protein
MFTTFTAIVIALVLSITIRPGSRAKNIKNNTVIISEGPRSKNNCDKYHI